MSENEPRMLLSTKMAILNSRANTFLHDFVLVYEDGCEPEKLATLFGEATLIIGKWDDIEKELAE